MAAVRSMDIELQILPKERKREIRTEIFGSFRKAMAINTYGILGRSGVKDDLC